MLNYLKNHQKTIADYLSYCDSADYEQSKYTGDLFILSLDKFIKREKVQKTVFASVSQDLEKSTFAAEIIALEENINKSEALMDKILQF